MVPSTGISNSDSERERRERPPLPFREVMFIGSLFISIQEIVRGGDLREQRFFNECSFKTDTGETCYVGAGFFVF